MTVGTLGISLAPAVMLRIEEMKLVGGPSADDLAAAVRYGSVIANRGDVLLHKGGKEGEAAALFNQMARTIATLSFMPGGVTLFGNHWESGF